MEEKQYVVDALSINESWRVFRIMAEFVEGIETLSQVNNAVTIFGSARLKPEDIYYQKTESLARLLVKDGFNVITGGGPGVMEAANKGASEAGGKSVGLNIELPFEQAPNMFIDADKYLSFDYFFVRKVMFIKYSQGFVVMPGGFGTLDEFFEAITLIQTHKLVNFPVVLVGRDYWNGLIEWMKDKVVAEKNIGPNDLNIFEVVDTSDEVVKVIDDFYTKYSLKPNF